MTKIKTYDTSWKKKWQFSNTEQLTTKKFKLNEVNNWVIIWIYKNLLTNQLSSTTYRGDRIKLNDTLNFTLGQLKNYLKLQVKYRWYKHERDCEIVTPLTILSMLNHQYKFCNTIWAIKL